MKQKSIKTRFRKYFKRKIHLNKKYRNSIYIFIFMSIIMHKMFLVEYNREILGILLTAISILFGFTLISITSLIGKNYITILKKNEDDSISNGQTMLQTLIRLIQVIFHIQMVIIGAIFLEILFFSFIESNILNCFNGIITGLLFSNIYLLNILFIQIINALHCED